MHQIEWKLGVLGMFILGAVALIAYTALVIQWLKLRENKVISGLNKLRDKESKEDESIIHSKPSFEG